MGGGDPTRLRRVGSPFPCYIAARVSPWIHSRCVGGGTDIEHAHVSRLHGVRALRRNYEGREGNATSNERKEINNDNLPRRARTRAFTSTFLPSSPPKPPASHFLLSWSSPRSSNLPFRAVRGTFVMIETRAPTVHAESSWQAGNKFRAGSPFQSRRYTTLKCLTTWCTLLRARTHAFGCTRVSISGCLFVCRITRLNLEEGEPDDYFAFALSTYILNMLLIRTFPRNKIYLLDASFAHFLCKKIATDSSLFQFLRFILHILKSVYCFFFFFTSLTPFTFVIV